MERILYEVARRVEDRVVKGEERKEGLKGREGEEEVISKREIREPLRSMKDGKVAG